MRINELLEAGERVARKKYNPRLETFRDSGTPYRVEIFFQNRLEARKDSLQKVLNHKQYGKLGFFGNEYFRSVLWS
jgi:hypothetical protein